MDDLLTTIYPWVKSIHVMAVIAWMAGLFYLPRLFVYHAEQVSSSLPEAEEMFRLMERRLLKQIMNPAMVTAWVLGIVLVLTPQAGVYPEYPWVWVKGAAILGMTGFHMWLAACRRGFAEGRNTITGRGYRIMNEVPTVLMVAIVLAVIVKF
jgi:putative membrane protein